VFHVSPSSTLAQVKLPVGEKVKQNIFWLPTFYSPILPTLLKSDNAEIAQIIATNVGDRFLETQGRFSQRKLISH